MSILMVDAATQVCCIKTVLEVQRAVVLVLNKSWKISWFSKCLFKWVSSVVLICFNIHMLQLILGFVWRISLKNFSSLSIKYILQSCFLWKCKEDLKDLIQNSLLIWNVFPLEIFLNFILKVMSKRVYKETIFAICWAIPNNS